MSLLDDVRARCAEVAANARLVTINHEYIGDYAASFPVEQAIAAADADRVSPGRSNESDDGNSDDGDSNDVAWSDERRIALALATVAVNFTSGWHDIMPKRPGLSGAVSTVTRLTDYEAATGAFTPDRLQAITVTDASQIFETPLDSGALEELQILLAASLNQLGALAAEHGSFVDLVGSAGHEAETLAGMLATLPSFDDRAPYSTGDGRTLDVPFLKRAQMAAATLHREFDGAGPGRFDDLGRLTIFADNLVPHVLRLDGLLSYEPDLLATINAGSLLTFGSPEEVEIRAGGVHAVELLIAEIADRGESITAADVDHALWTRGGGAEYKAHRRHRCRNAWY